MMVTTTLSDSPSFFDATLGKKENAMPLGKLVP
jgi:hypothetical protein